MTNKKLEPSKVLHISKDCVSLAELAAFFGVNREYMRRFIVKYSIAIEVSTNLRNNRLAKSNKVTEKRVVGKSYVMNNETWYDKLTINEIMGRLRQSKIDQIKTKHIDLFNF